MGETTIGQMLAQAHQMKVTSVTAQAFLAHILGCGRAWLLAHQEEHLTPEQAAKCIAWVERVARGEPLAYLTGEREFCGLSFVVTPDVLIPRPETEMLVEVALEWVEVSGAAFPSVIDVGTGSGAIAVTLSVKLPDTCIWAVDISEEALDVARRNADRHGANQRIRFVRGDLLEMAPGPWDLILANLPYIPSELLRTLDVSRWEPYLALDGGPDGLALIRRLIRQARSRLAPKGWLAMEIQYDQGELVMELCKESFPAVEVEVRRDLAGLDRVVVVKT